MAMGCSGWRSAQGICPGRLPDLVMAAGAGQQRLFVIPSEKMVIVRFANENMPRAVMAGDYVKLRLDFNDNEFFARLFGWRQSAHNPTQGEGQ
jgi:CubicO group peptidase (beta-lactamase class C family)